MDDNKLKVFIVCGSALMVVLAILLHTQTKNIIICIRDMCFMICIFVMLFILYDVVLRVCYFLLHSATKADDFDGVSPWDIFALNTASVITAMIVIVLLTSIIMTTPKYSISYVWEYGAYICLSCILLSVTLLKAINFSVWEVQGIFPISDMKGLDYGTGMAYSFYYGYLRIVLPSTGTASKGIEEKIEQFENTHNVTIPVKKLFILIPSSSHIPPDLKEASYQWMESAVTLEDEVRDRAGVKKRTYRNNVYKIYPGGIKSGSEPVFIVAEGATPMLTLYEVQKHAHPESSTYKKHLKQIILAFYKKLQELLDNDPECKNLCELVHYDDYNSNGTKVNVAKVLLEKLSEVQNISNVM